MQPTNTGSFGAAIGGMTPELEAAVSRRGGGAAMQPPAMSQVSNTAPTFDPTAQGAPIPPMQGLMGQSTPQPTQSMGQPTGSDEAQIILNALSARLKSDSKIKEAQSIPPMPQF